MPWHGSPEHFFRATNVYRPRCHRTRYESFGSQLGDVRKLRAMTQMKLVIKGIVTARGRSVVHRNGADGIIVSNHGGRAEESGRATIECLPEVVDAVRGRVPVMIDGGFRRAQTFQSTRTRRACGGYWPSLYMGSRCVRRAGRGPAYSKCSELN